MDRYMVLVFDREKAFMFSLRNGAVEKFKKLKKGFVPQEVKHGDDTWDAQDKINRHIEDHLHRHLKHVALEVGKYATENHISQIIIGTHKALFSKIEKLIPYPFSDKVKGRFITEVKGPFNEVVKRAKFQIEAQKGAR